MPRDRHSFGRRARRVVGSTIAIGLLAACGVLVSVGLAGPRGALVDPTTATTTTIPTTGKITICHRTHSKKHPSHTISVSVHAAPAHLRHGDTLGACVTTAPPTTTGATARPTAANTAAPAHAPGNSGNAPGHSGEHGKGHNK
jgi:hypothetical protein